jgi:transcriptional regulator with XRE-family HTH domain
MRHTVIRNEHAYISRDCLAHHVKRLRQERGWSQLQLAEASGLHRSHVCRLEHGLYNATINTVDEIANAFGVHPGVLLEPPADVDSRNDSRRGDSRDSHLAHRGANQARGAIHFFRGK